ncbi:MAG: hypothetical protein ACRD17_15100 [Terriglobales bacterium]
MIRSIALSIALVAAAAPATAQLPRQDSAVLIVRQHGQLRGQEHFQLRATASGGRLQARLNYIVSGHPVRQTATLEWRAGARLESYIWRQGTDAVTIGFAAGRLQAHYHPAHGATQVFQFQLPPDTAILDANVYSLWEPLADRYVLARGGVQSFRVFVPHTGIPGHVRLTRLPVSGRDRAAGLVQLQAETGQATLFLTLRRGRLLTLRLPAAGLTVSRQR